MIVFQVCAIFLTLMALVITWALFMPEDQGSSRFERIVNALESYVEEYKNNNRHNRGF